MDFNLMPRTNNARLRLLARSLEEEFGDDPECRIFIRDLLGELPKETKKMKKTSMDSLVRVFLRYIYLAGTSGVAVWQAERAGRPRGKGLLARTQEEYESLFGNKRKSDWLARRAARQKEAILEEARQRSMRKLEKSLEDAPAVFVESLTNPIAGENI